MGWCSCLLDSFLSWTDGFHICSTLFFYHSASHNSLLECCQKGNTCGFFFCMWNTTASAKTFFCKAIIDYWPILKKFDCSYIPLYEKKTPTKQQDISTAVAKYDESWNGSICFFHTFPLLCFNLFQPTWSVFTQIRSVPRIKFQLFYLCAIKNEIEIYLDIFRIGYF